MKYKDMNKLLLLEFPELNDEIKRMQYGFGDTLTYELYEGVFNTYLYNMIMECKNEKIIEKIFTFCENMAKSDDIEVQNLLQVGILEFIWDNAEIRDLAKSYMYNKTLEMFNELKSYMN